MRDSVQVLRCDSPHSMVLQNTITKALEDGVSIFNCDPLQDDQGWPEETTCLLRHWLTRPGVEAWFVRVMDKAGMLFFRDADQRIINARTMLVKLQLAKSISFSYEGLEASKLAKLKVAWVELHDLTIDYSQFRIKSCPAKREFSPVAPSSPDKKFKDLPADPPKTTTAEKSIPRETTLKVYSAKLPIFVHSKEHPEPFQSLDQVPFQPKLKAALASPDLSFHMHVWASALTGGSPIFIEPSKVSVQNVFEPLVYDFVYTRVSTNKSNTGPLAVCVVDTRAQAETLHVQINRLTSVHTQQLAVNVLVDAYAWDDDRVQDQLTCDILIVTLSMVTNLRQRKANESFCMTEAKQFLFMNVHNMNGRELMEVFHFCRAHKPDKQVMVLSSTWSRILHKLSRQLTKPTVIFGSPIEFSFMANTQMEVKIIRGQQEQLQVLVAVIRGTIDPSTRTAIICKNAEAMQVVQTELERNAIDFCTVGAVPPRQANVCLLTDKLIRDMIVDPVDVIIHFSMPKWRFFSHRFVLFERNFTEQLPTRTLVLLDVDDHKAFLPEIETICKRSNALMDMCRALKTAQEPREEFYCPQQALYGNCRQYFSCPHRHALNRVDVPSWRLFNTVGATVDFKFSALVAPNHFQVELVPSPKERERVQCELADLKFDLCMFMGREENRVKMPECKVGDLCAFKETQFRRAQVVEQPRPGLAKVQCLDTGNQFLMRQNEIYQLPEKYHQVEPQVLDVFLMGAVPRDPLSGWSVAASVNLRTRMNSLSGPRFVMKGKVAFVLGRRIFVTSLKVQERLEHGLTICSLDVAQWLYEQEFARPDKEGEYQLQKAVDECDLYSNVQVPKQDEKVIADDVAAVDEGQCHEMQVEVDQQQEEEEDQKEAEVEMADDSGFPRTDTPVEEQTEDDGQYYEEQWDDDNDETFEYKAPEPDTDLPEFDVNNLDCNFDMDDLVNLFPHMFPNRRSEPPAAIRQGATIEEIVEEEEEQPKKQKAAEVAKPVPIPQENILPPLISTILMPIIHWSQSDNEIKMRISAVDVLDYEVRVDPTDINVWLKFQDEERGCSLPFFGTVNNEEGSLRVELRGLMIVVTMQKLLPGKRYLWPRLTSKPLIARWLKYYQKFDDVDKDELEEDHIEVMPLEETGENGVDNRVDLRYMS